MQRREGRAGTTLLQDKDKLTAILTYHVVPGKVMAADVTGLSSATTVQGQPRPDRIWNQL